MHVQRRVYRHHVTGYEFPPRCFLEITVRNVHLILKKTGCQDTPTSTTFLGDM